MSLLNFKRAKAGEWVDRVQHEGGDCETEFAGWLQLTPDNSHLRLFMQRIKADHELRRIVRKLPPPPLPCANCLRRSGGYGLKDWLYDRRDELYDWSLSIRMKLARRRSRRRSR